MITFYVGSGIKNTSKMLFINEKLFETVHTNIFLKVASDGLYFCYEHVTVFLWSHKRAPTRTMK